MKRLFLLVLIVVLSGCMGKIGVRWSQGTGYDGRIRSEIYYDVPIVDFDK